MTDPRTSGLLDLLDFVAKEDNNFRISAAHRPDELAIVAQLQALYVAAVPNVAVHENDMAVFQLLVLTHCYFLSAVAAMMRCHLSEAFGSARIAIDAAMVAAQIIADPASQIAYANKTAPFDNYMRYLGNLVAAGRPLPHPLIPHLRALYSNISQFSNHADAGSFVHRIEFCKEPGKQQTVVNYFQFSENDTEREIHALSLFHVFVLVLDVFSDFLVVKQKLVPIAWQEELRALGGALERRARELRETLPVSIIS
jgi:hypothetical protein